MHSSKTNAEVYCIPKDVFNRIKRIEEYKKVKALYDTACWQVDHLSTDLESRGTPRNPRQDLLNRLDADHCRGLQMQKQRLQERLRVLEKSIKKDMDEYNTVE